MHSLELKNIMKSYDNGLLVLDDFSLSVDEGEFVVLVGPSGCGKSTLLKIISGLEDVNGGTISIGGKVMNNVSPKNRKVSMVFQNYALYPHMSVFENLSFSLKIKKMKKDRIIENVKQVSELLDIQDILDRKPNSISGGQKQRVALGRAIIRKPAIMLLDEPLSNLDAKLRVSLRSELKNIHREMKSTMIYVTHDQVEAMTLGDRVAVIDKGILKQVDSPMSLYNKPQNKFVAGFIGSPPMNFITMTKSIREMLKEKKTSIDDWLLEKELSDISIGVRPESLSMEKSGESIGLEANLELVEPIGHEIHYHFNHMGNMITMISNTNYPEIDKNASVNVFADISDLYFFDNLSGAVIEPS